MRLVATSTSTWSTQSTTSWRLSSSLISSWICWVKGWNIHRAAPPQNDLSSWMHLPSIDQFSPLPISILFASKNFLPRKQHQLSFAWFHLVVQSNCFSSLYEANTNHVDKFRFFSINQLLNFIHLLAILDSSNFVHFHFFSFDFS